MKSEGTSASASGDLFGDAVKGGLTSINAGGLIVCTIVGSALTIYGEIAGATTPLAFAIVALIGWLAAIVLTLYLAGRDAAQERSLGSTLVRGVGAARAKPRFALLILLLTAGAAFTVWSRAQADKGGAIASLRSDVRQAAVAASQAEASASVAAVEARSVRQTLESQETAAAALSRMGYRPTTEDACRAVAAGDAAALALMTKISAPSVSINLGGGQWATCLESALLDSAASAKVAAGLNAFALSAKDRDRLYVGQEIGNANERNLRVRALVKSMVPDAGSGVILTSVRGTPLMYAVRADNAEAVEALLRQGANVDEPGRVDVSVQTPRGSRMETLATSPLREARRLGLKRVEPILASASARETSERRAFFK